MMWLNQLCSNLHFLLQIILLLAIYQQITNVTFKKRWFIIIPVVLRLLFFILPPVAYFATLLFLIVYSFYCNRYHNRLLDIFYGLYPVIVESLFNRVISHLILPIFGISFSITSSSDVILFAIELSIYPLYYLMMKVLKVNFTSLQEGFERRYLNQFLLLVDISMIAYFVALQILVIFDNFIPSSLHYRELLVGIYLVLFFAMLVYMNGTFKEKLEEEILIQKDRQITDLTNYSKQIEYLYNEIRNFRHDYINILSSIKSGIDSKDITIVEKVYDNVLAKSSQQIQGKRYNIANLINVKNEAIKSVLSAKILEAQSKGVDISVEVFEPFELTHMDLLDFITILGILLDNAIEATQPETCQNITIALIAGDEEVLIVENSIFQEEIDISNIYNQGYSTKGENRGIGLSNVKKILLKYPKVSLQTKSKDYKFRQILVMK